jgi:hypothetical protein
MTAPLIPQQDVFDAIAIERNRQLEKWGVHKAQSLAYYLLIIERLVEEAKEGWNHDLPGKKAPLNVLVEVAAVCTAALEQYGTTGNTISKSDVPVPQEQ